MDDWYFLEHLCDGEIKIFTSLDSAVLYRIDHNDSIYCKIKEHDICGGYPWGKPEKYLKEKTNDR